MQPPGARGLNYGSLLKQGTRHLQGVEEAVLRNLEAVSDLADMTQTSYGPNGMNKLIINHLEKIFITSDAATMLSEIQIAHPAAKVVVMASKMQEQEMGDGTNFVLVFTGELLSLTEELLRIGLHQSEIQKGFEMAGEFVLKALEEQVCLTIDSVMERSVILPIVATALNSKQFGGEMHLAEVVTDSCLNVVPPPQAGGAASMNTDSVRVIKVLGGGLDDSYMLKGFVSHKAPHGSITRVTGSPTIAVYTCALDNSSTETKGTVLIENAEQLLGFSAAEEVLIDRNIKEIADAGVKVVVTHSTVSKLALHFCEKYRLMVVKILSKFELRRLCRAIGAVPLARLGRPSPDDLGSCASVQFYEVGSTPLTFFEVLDSSSMLSTVILRGSTTSVLDDMERAVADGVAVFKASCKDGRFVAGAGAVETELSKLTHAYADSLPGLEQYAVHRYAQALDVIPRILAQNCGLDGTTATAAVHAVHEDAAKPHSSYMGIDVVDTAGQVGDIKLVNAQEKGIVDHLVTKHWALKLATDAAMTILKVDQIIMAKPAGGPKAPAQQGHWDEED